MHGYAGLVILALMCQSALSEDVEASHATDKGSVLVAALVSPAGLQPSVRVFAASSFALGGWFSANGERSRPSGEDPTTIIALSFGPEATYFFGKPGSALLPYVDGCATLGFSNSRDSYGDYESSQAGLKLAVGLCPLIGKHGAAMVEVGYSLSEHTVGYVNDLTSGSTAAVYIAAGFGGFIF